MKLKRTLALLLATTLLLTLVASCGKTPDAPEVQAQPSETPAQSAAPISTEPVANPLLYTATKINLPLDAALLENASTNPLHYSIFAYSNERIYIERSTEIKEDGEVVGQRFEILSFDVNGSDERSEWSYETMYSPNDVVQTVEYLYAYKADSDGNLWVSMCYEQYDNTDERAPVRTRWFDISKYATDGTLVGTSIVELSGERLGVDKKITFDRDGNAYLTCIEMWEDGMSMHQVYSAETASLVDVSRKTIYYFSLSNTRDGDVCYFFADEIGMEFVVYSMENGTLKETRHEYKFAGFQAPQRVFPGFGEWDVFFEDGLNALVGFNFETGAQASIIDLEGSGIVLPKMSPDFPYLCIPRGGVIQLSETEFLLSLGSEGLHKLTSDPFKADKNRVTLTLATVWDNGAPRDAVREFNMKNSGIRIEIVDYSNGGRFGVAEAVAQIDLDILRGEGPDILDLKGQTPGKYINKGLLADLTEFLNSDTTISREELFENALELCETDGKLYHITTQFLPVTLVGKTSIFGNSDGLQINDITAALAQYPRAELISEYTNQQWMSICTSLMLGEIIDWENGTCDFTNPKFIELLNSAKRAPAETQQVGTHDPAEYGEIYEAYAKKVAANEVLLGFGVLHDMRSARTFAEIYGADMAFLGFPASNGGATLNPMNDYAIMEASEHKSEAWEFLSFLLRDEYESIWKIGTSINRAGFEKSAAAECVPLLERDFSQMLILTHYSPMAVYSEVITSPDDVRSARYDNYHLTADEVGEIRRAIEGATSISFGDEQIMQIVSEEVDAFLNGARTAEETAKIIQSRASLYVGEQS